MNFIKRLERAEKALELLERRRAFFGSSERKVDFTRLNSVEMGCIDIYFRNTGLDASRLAETEKLALDEIFEKAAGIRDYIDMEIDFMANESGKRHFTLKRHRVVRAPWENAVIHRYGRYLALLEKAVRSDPVLNPPPPPSPPSPTRVERMRQRMVKPAQLVWELDPSEEDKQKWLALAAKNKRFRIEELDN